MISSNSEFASIFPITSTNFFRRLENYSGKSSLIILYCIPYPWLKVAQLVTLKNSSTCLGKGAAPDKKRRTLPPNASFIFHNIIALILCKEALYLNEHI